MKTFQVMGFLFLVIMGLGCTHVGDLMPNRGIVFHVAPGGDDRGTGTLDDPFETLHGARDAVRRIEDRTDRDVRVMLRGGLYVLDQPLDLKPEDSGQGEGRVIYEAYPGETPVISGGRRLARWKKLTASPQYLTNEARGKLWVHRIEKDWRPHYLYDIGESRQVARHPNNDDWQNWPKVVEVGDREPGGQLITFPEGTLEGIPTNGDVEMCWVPTYWWMNELAVLRDVDPAASSARRHSMNVTYRGKPGDGFRLHNALVLLDEPGEWCVDSEAGMLYYWPPDGDIAPDDEIIATRLYNLIRMDGDPEGDGPLVRNITIRGLTLQHTDRMPEDQWPEPWLKRNFENPDAAVFMKGVESCVVESCRIIQTGTYAIALDKYAQHNRIEGNELGWLRCGGVQVYGFGPGTLDVNKHNIIRRNHIHHIGRAPYWHSAAIIIFGSNNNHVSLNYIHDTPYVGVGIVGAFFQDLNWIKRDEVDAYGRHGNQYKTRWHEVGKGAHERWTQNTGTITWREMQNYLHNGDNLIEHNIIINVMQILHDGGALYSFSTARGNVMRENLLHNARDTFLNVPIYLDNEADGFLVERNQVWGPGRFVTRGWNLWYGNVRTDERTEGFDRLFERITRKATKQGGWLGASPDDIESNFRTTEFAINPIADIEAPTGEPYAQQWLDGSAAINSVGVEVDEEGHIYEDGVGIWAQAISFGPFHFEPRNQRYVEIEAAYVPSPDCAWLKSAHVAIGEKAIWNVGLARIEPTGDLDTYAISRAPLLPFEGSYVLRLLFEGEGQVRIKRFRILAGHVPEQ